MNMLSPQRLLWLLFIPLLITGSAFGQQGREIRGVIYDAGTGAPLTGVTVSISGRAGSNAAPANGPALTAVTDSSGAFTIRVGDRSTLILTYIGYERAEYRVGSENIIRVGMKKTDKSMDEVVVIGYGTVKK